jgi:hypothetical protein
MIDTLLRWSLIVGGLFSIFGLSLMFRSFPDGWCWLPRNTSYEHMILAIYAVMGVFMLLAARRPRAWGGFLWFTVAANLAHAAVMLVDGLRVPADHANLTGDIPALFALTAWLAFLLWKAGVRLGTAPSALAAEG